jgi:hypothetical protein
VLRQNGFDVIEQIGALRQDVAAVAIFEPAGRDADRAGDFLQAEDIGLSAGEIIDQRLMDLAAPGVQRNDPQCRLPALTAYFFL